MQIDLKPEEKAITSGQRLLATVLVLVAMVALVDLMPSGLRRDFAAPGGLAVMTVWQIFEAIYLGQLIFTGVKWAHVLLRVQLIFRGLASALTVARAAIDGGSEIGTVVLLAVVTVDSLAFAAVLTWHPLIHAYLAWVREPRNVFQRL